MMLKRAVLCLAVVGILAGSAVWAGHHEAEFEAMASKWEAAYNEGDAAAAASRNRAGTSYSSPLA